MLQADSDKQNNAMAMAGTSATFILLPFVGCLSERAPFDLTSIGGKGFPATSGCHALRFGKNNGFLIRDDKDATNSSYINIAHSAAGQVNPAILTEMETEPANP